MSTRSLPTVFLVWLVTAAIGCTARDAGLVDLSELDLALERGSAVASDLWHDPRWSALREDAGSRMQVARLLRDHPRETVTVATATEPGRRLTFDGRVVDAQGAPVEGALLFLYQTDAEGRYAPEAAEPGDGDRNARLFAWLLTDEDGAFTVHTILPGGYGGAPPHFHLSVAPSRTELEARQPVRVYFAGDWSMHPEVLEDARTGHALISAVRDEGGTLYAEATIVLRS